MNSMLMLASEKPPPNSPSMPGLNRRPWHDARRSRGGCPTKDLFGVDGGAALESDALRLGPSQREQQKDTTRRHSASKRL